MIFVILPVNLDGGPRRTPHAITLNRIVFPKFQIGWTTKSGSWVLSSTDKYAQIDQQMALIPPLDSKTQISNFMF